MTPEEQAAIERVESILASEESGLLRGGTCVATVAAMRTVLRLAKQIAPVQICAECGQPLDLSHPRQT
jgi:hypothetical protein